MFCLDSPGQQSALQGVERFTLGEQTMNLAAEFGIDEIIEHKHATCDLANQGAAFIDRAPARGAAMALNDGRCGTISTLERCCDMLKAIPSSARRTAERHTLDNRLKARGHRYTARQIEFAPRKSGEARTKIKAQNLGQSHREMGEAVCVDRQTLAALCIVPNPSRAQ